MFVWIRCRLSSPPPALLGCGGVVLGRWRDSASPKVGVLQAHIPAMENQPRDGQVLRGAELQTGNGTPEPAVPCRGTFAAVRGVSERRAAAAGPHRGGAEPCAPRAFPVLPACPKQDSRCCRGAPGALGAAEGLRGLPRWPRAVTAPCGTAAPALAGESQPRVARQGSGLAGLGRHLLGAQRVFWAKPLKLFFFILKVWVLPGNPQSVRGEQPTLPSRCSPTRTPLLLFGCLVPSLPKSHCTDTSASAQAADVPCWSCLCLSPALFSRPPLACSLVRAKSVQCWLCQVNYFHPRGAFAVAVARVGLWRAKNEPFSSTRPAPASMDTPRGLGRASVQIPPRSGLF